MTDEPEKSPPGAVGRVVITIGTIIAVAFASGIAFLVTCTAVALNSGDRLNLALVLGAVAACVVGSAIVFVSTLVQKSRRRGGR